MKKNKIFLLIISLMAASILWIYVVTVVNPEGNRTITGIPVVFSGEDVLREDQSLILPLARTAAETSEFHGKNADLNKLLQQQDEITAVIDVTRIRTAKSYTMSYDLNLPNSVQDAGITVTSRSPSSITFEVQKQVSMPIEIRGDFTGVSVAEGYMLEKTSFDYDVVQVTGPESVVSTIDCAQVVAGGRAPRGRRRDQLGRQGHDRPGMHHALRRLDGARRHQQDHARHHRSGGYGVEHPDAEL